VARTIRARSRNDSRRPSDAEVAGRSLRLLFRRFLLRK
jgi:hypothetical protein